MSKRPMNILKRQKRARAGEKLTGWGQWKRITRRSHPEQAWPEHADRAWVNNKFIVIGIPYRYDRGLEDGGMPCGWLEIQRIDGRPGVTWAEKQRIKNQLVDREALAFEVFPPESELVDGYNIYHLWVLPRGCVLPTALGNPHAKLPYTGPLTDNPLGMMP